MGSLDAALVRKALAKNVVGSVVDDGAVAIRMRYVGTGTVTSVTTVSGTGITMITSDGGTDAYEFGTYTTVGALVDKINGDGIFEAKVLDTIRAEATDDQFINGVISSSTLRDGKVSTTVWDVLVDTDAADYTAYRLTWDRGFEREAQKRAHTVSLREIVYNLNISAAEAEAVKVYEIDGTNETLVLSRKSVDATKTTINFASGEGKLDAAFGNDLVVYIMDTTSITDASDNYLEVGGILE